MEATIDSSSSSSSSSSNNNNNSSNNDDCVLPIYRDKTVSFGEWDSIRDFFDENGYVVVTDVLTPEEMEETLEDLWTNPRLLGRPDIDRKDPTTWSSKSWPQSDGGKNFLDSNDVFQDRAAWHLTAHPKVVEVQRFLYKCDDLMKDNFGRWGVMRPTAENPEWKTESSWLHWDQNPWTEPDFIRLQAIVCLTNNTPTSGGFACVPGFHRQFLEWGQAHPLGSVKSKSGVTLDEGYGVNQPFPIPAEDPCQQRVVRVLAPSGSVVIWDSRLPHQNFPNTDAAEMRIVHYCMLKMKEETEAGILRNMLRKKMIVMETLGTKGPRFPDNLSSLARDIYCLSDAPDVRGSDDLSVSDNLKAAIPLVYQAGEAEDRGDIQLAIQYHSRALRIYPDIENWYDAILG